MLKASKFLLASALTLSLLPSLAFGQTSDAFNPSSLPGSLNLPYVYNGATWDRLRGSTSGLTVSNFPAAATLSDAFANPTTTNVGGMNHLFNGTTWDRQRSAVGTTGIPSVNTEGTKATFDTSVQITFAAAAAANDFCALPGSATKTIRVLYTEIALLATAASDTTVRLSKRSAASTGTAGTSMTVVPRDSSSTAGTAVPVSWVDSSAQVPGAAVGNIGIYFAQIQAVASGLPAPLKISFANSDNTSAVVLRGVAQVLAWNLAAQAAAAGQQAVCRFTYTEE